MDEYFDEGYAGEGEELSSVSTLLVQETDVLSPDKPLTSSTRGVGRSNSKSPIRLRSVPASPIRSQQSRRLRASPTRQQQSFPQEDDVRAYYEDQLAALEQQCVFRPCCTCR